MTDKNQILFNEFSIFGLSKNKSPSEVTLRSAEWAVITQLDGNKNLTDIAQTLAFSIEEAIEIFSGLYDKGLIEYVSAEKLRVELVSPDFFKRLNMELSRIIGPVASFVIEDVLWGMDQKKDYFRINKISELIEAITEEIPDDAKKLTFQQTMLELIKEYG